MTNFIPPLALKTWVIDVLSGTPDIFAAVAILVITGIAAYFRMTTLTMFFILGVFFLMFSEFITSPILILMALIGGLAIGYWISKLVSR